jgi:hypothetical protein
VSSGRPAAPRKTRRLAWPAGLAFLAVAFLLEGIAGGGLGGSSGSRNQNLQPGGACGAR